MEFQRENGPPNASSPDNGLRSSCVDDSSRLPYERAALEEDR
jgi:hypothetical protein